jgi:hypothetical protein
LGIEIIEWMGFSIQPSKMDHPKQNWPNDREAFDQ